MDDVYSWYVEKAELPVFGFEQLERQELALVDIKLNVEVKIHKLSHCCTFFLLGDNVPLSLDNRYPDYSACPIGFRSAIVRLSIKLSTHRILRCLRL